MFDRGLLEETRQLVEEYGAECRPLTSLGYPDADRRAALIGSQLLGLALCRYILRLQPLASLSADEIVAGLAPTIQRYLTQPIPGA